MLPFSCDEYHMRLYGSSMDQVERAIYAFRPAIGCLKYGQGSMVCRDEIRV